MAAKANREAAIFELVLEKPSAERAALLDAVCAGDPALRARLEALLAAHDGAGPLATEAAFTRPTVPVEFAEPVDEAIGQVIGRYKLLEKVGEGGCGVVYVAEQTEPVRRRVALKVIKLGMDTKAVVARFEAERQALAMMDHPNIAKVLDAGTTETGRPYFVMELVRGIRITEYCDQHHLSTKDRLELFIKVCQAIQHAHQKGIIHRDIKPSNILVTLHDGVPVPKVIDFGIAKATEGRLTDATVYTQLHQFIGTPAYMSPEQAEMSGLDIDTRSDIYSLGVLLYELLAGKTPFDAQELMAQGLDAMRRTIREKEPVRPSTKLTQELVTAGAGPRKSSVGLAIPAAEEINADARRRLRLKEQIARVKGDLDWIVMKCLEKDRTRRYETASGLAADLRRHLDNEPVTARPPSKLYEFQKTVRRHKFGFAATAAIMAVLTAGVALSTWQAVRARHAEREALQAQQSEVQQRQAAYESRDNERRAREELEHSLYLKSMAVAHWDLTREPPAIVEAETLLDSCESKLRGWEWYYLKRQWLTEPYVLRDPGQHGLNSVAFSPDDRYLASAGADGKVTVWEVATRRALRSITADTNSFVFSVAFDPSDSSRLVSAGSENHVKLWNWKTTNLLHSWPIRFSFQWGMAYAVAFSPDGQRVAAANGKGLATIWSASTGEELLNVSGQDEDAPDTIDTTFSLAFSPDGQRLATGSGDGIVRVWDARTGKLLSKFGRPTNPIGGLAFSQADGRRLIAAGFDSTVMVWDVASSSLLSHWRAHSGRGIHGLALSPDNKRLATGGFDRTVKLWDADSGREVLTFNDFTKEVQCLSFSHDGRRLVACSVDGTIRMWDATPRTDEKGESLLTLTNPVPIAAMALRKDGLWLACGGDRLPEEQGGTAPVFIWDTRTGQPLPTLHRKSLFLFSVEFSPDGRFLAGTGDDRDYRRGYTMQIWDLASGRPSFRTEPFPGEGVVFCQSYSPNGRWLLGGTQDGRILVWDGVTGKTNAVLGRHNGSVFCLAFSPDGRYLASAAHTEQVRIWDGTRLTVLQTNPIEIATAVGDFTDTLAFGPDSRRLVVATDDRVAQVWDLENRTNKVSLRSESVHGFRAVAFSPDGRWIASGGTDCKVKLWNASTGDLIHTFRGHKGEVYRLRFLPHAEGMRLVSGAFDSMIKFWDLRPFQSAEHDANRTADENP